MICPKSIQRLAVLFVSIISLLSLLIPGRAYCSNPEGVDFQKDDYKKWQLLFSTGSYFTPNPFEDMAIALQRRISDRECIRLGIGYKYNRLDNHYIEYDKGIFDYESDYDTSMSQISASCCFVNYYNPGDKVRPFLGAGPFFAFSGRKQNTVFQDRDYKWDLTSYFIGIKTLIGADLRIKSFLNFHAEYNLDLYYGFSRREQTSIFYYPGYTYEYIDKRDNKTFAVEANAVRAGISVVF